MSIAFESDGKVLPNWKLFLRGLGFLVVLVLIGVAMIARSEGVFNKSVQVTADLVNVGDGLPSKSDVKYEGVLVGMVDSVTPSTDGGPNHVHISLLPQYSSGIPSTVTARVVPSNVFAVPSVQLVYNGQSRSLASGAHITEDRSLATVRLQTSLTALDKIVAAAGRSESDPVLGILTTVEQATAGHGAAAARAGAELTRIAQAFNGVMAPDGTVSMLATLADALSGLRDSAPDLLGAVHNAVGPLRTVAEQRDQLSALLSGGLTTTGTVAAALEHNTGTITNMTSKFSPVLDVLARGSANFMQMTTSETNLSSKFRTLWNPKTQNMTGKIIIELTPHKQYTRADCPRYGNLVGPSCATGPAGGPTIVAPHTAPASYTGGNVGDVGSAREQRQIASILGGKPNTATDLIVGPLLRDNSVTIAPAADTQPVEPSGAPR
ncbi:MCE family protein [Nocardia sp. CA2R105]|uniref:MlaD family protein n=1 Tax=Nocardia coffeae TaxID=2873381 RepID=UPI001CA6938D|nr:MCE family protein [Nocardia coffeae]MBY8859966.1 MCE family protein [Nocardia coffeae]